MKTLLILILSLWSIINCSQAQETFNHTITFEEKSYTIEFTKYSVRGPLFNPLEQQPNGTLLPIASPEIRTYIGYVTELTGSLASGLIRADGSRQVRLVFEDGSEWIDNNGAVSERSSPAFSTMPSYTLDRPAGATLYAIDVAIDLPFPYISSAGGDAYKALEMAEFSMLSLNLIYLRDTCLINKIGQIILRTDEATDPYRGMTTTNELLNTISQELPSIISSNDPSLDHDLGLVASTQVGGGLAYVGVVGSGFSSNGSNANGDFSVVARHEIGHNWGLSHFDGGAAEGKTINSGNSLAKMSAAEIKKVLDQRDAKLSHLTPLGQTAPPVPPRAVDDIISVPLSATSFSITPTLNDHDSNGSLLTLQTLSSSTTSGHTVTKTSSNSSVEITFDGTHSLENDSFPYRVTDEDGLTSSAYVHINRFIESDTLAHLTFDLQDSSALDSSSQMHTGTLHGDASIQSGSLYLDGDGDYVSLPNRGVSTDAITYSAWVFREGDQIDWAGLIFSRGSEAIGLSVGTNNELRYHWDGGDWAYNSGLVIPDQTWTYIALVITPTTATFYLDDGTGLQTQSRNDTHPTKSQENYYRIGHDSHSGRYFKGMIDEVRIINRALSAEELIALKDNNLGVSNPSPIHGQSLTDSCISLEWTPSSGAKSQRLYLSEDYLEVKNGSSGSNADNGLLEASTDLVRLADMAEGTYYWRVDSTSMDNVLTKGYVWTFTIEPEGIVAYWKLNEELGQIASEHISSLSGVIHGSPTTEACHVTLGAQQCLCFNGSSDYLEVPYHETTNPESFTVSLWAKYSDSYNIGGYRSPLTSRDSAPSSGYMFYLTPSDTWAFWVGYNSWQQLTSTLKVESDTWYHLVGTHEAGVSKFYLNGSLVTSKNTGYLRNERSPLRIGAGNTNESPQYYFPGCIDEVQIWKRALSEEEILDLRSYSQWADQYDIEKESRAWHHVSGSNGMTNLHNYALMRDPNQLDSSFVMSVNPETNLLSTAITLPYPLRKDVTYTIAGNKTLNEELWETLGKSAGGCALWQWSNQYLIKTDLTPTTSQFLFAPQEQSCYFWRMTYEINE